MKKIITIIIAVFTVFLLLKTVQTYNASGDIKQKTIYVSPAGEDQNSGLSPGSPLKTIQKAIDTAQPGQNIILSEGIYQQDFFSVRNGQKDAPVTISGPKGAIVKGAGKDRIIEINHSYMTLSGFSVDGQAGVGDKPSHYRDKLIYVQGKKKYSGVVGLKILNMTIKNAAGECIRLRYFARDNEISGNDIQNCGIADFKFDGGGKNGEGIYIGTAPEQRKDGKNPTSDKDESNNNWVHDNTINTQGNECVDIKEGSSGNIVEKNTCTGQGDADSGGMDSRGNANTFRNNEIYENSGVGIRLGGDSFFDGTGNNVYSNTLRDNKEGGIKFQRFPQGKVCGNQLAGSGSLSTGRFGGLFNPGITCGN